LRVPGLATGLSFDYRFFVLDVCAHCCLHLELDPLPRGSSPTQGLCRLAVAFLCWRTCSPLGGVGGCLLSRFFRPHISSAKGATCWGYWALSAFVDSVFFKIEQVGAPFLLVRRVPAPPLFPFAASAFGNRARCWLSNPSFFSPS